MLSKLRINLFWKSWGLALLLINMQSLLMHGTWGWR
jgi:hypothetical protein